MKIIGHIYVPRYVKRSLPCGNKWTALYLDQAFSNEFIAGRTRHRSISDFPGYTTGLRMIHATMSSRKTSKRIYFVYVEDNYYNYLTSTIIHNVHDKLNRFIIVSIIFFIKDSYVI